MPTQKEIAKRLDLSQQAVSQHMTELGIAWKTTSLDDITVAYIRKLRGAAAGHTSSDGEMDLTRERAQTERVDRELKMFMLAEKKGQVVNLEQLEPMLIQMVGAFRTELTSLGDKLKTEIDALYGIDLDVQLLEEHIRDSLSQLARYDPELRGPGAPAGEGARAAGEVVHNGLGTPVSADVEQSVG
jgi:DNA-binding transcriptional ArsR family regulator